MPQPRLQTGQLHLRQRFPRPVEPCEPQSRDPRMAQGGVRPGSGHLLPADGSLRPAGQFGPDRGGPGLAGGFCRPAATHGRPLRVLRRGRQSLLSAGKPAAVLRVFQQRAEKLPLPAGGEKLRPSRHVHGRKRGPRRVPADGGRIGQDPVTNQEPSMSMPNRLTQQAGRYSLVDGIPFHLPVSCQGSPVLMAVFTIDPAAAQKLIPGNEIFPFRFGSRALLVVTVVNYLNTTIGRYIEFSVAIACTHGERPAPPLLPALFKGLYGLGQFVVDLPVSTEISVKGGKGIWGMPKHQANLDYTVGDKVVSSQYDLDGQPAIRIEIDRPKC